jgi:hypothetical protein
VPTPERPKPEPFALPEDAPWSVDYAMPKPEDRPRVILEFAKPADKLLLSGMLEGGEELAGKAVVIDAPRGKGTSSSSPTIRCGVRTPRARTRW